MAALRSRSAWKTIRASLRRSAEVVGSTPASRTIHGYTLGMERFDPRRAATRLWASMIKEDDVRKGITALLMAVRMHLHGGMGATEAGRRKLRRYCADIREEILVLISRQKNTRTHTAEMMHRNRHRVRRTIRILRSYEGRIEGGERPASDADGAILDA